MKMFIPACGTRIKLSNPWTFTLYHEHRNDRLFKFMSLTYEGPSRLNEYQGGEPISVTVPADTTLEVDRVYIRLFSKEAETSEDSYDSVTFRVIDWPNIVPEQLNVGTRFGKGIRFWAKLNDVNSIEFELPNDAQYRDRPEAIKKAKKLKPFEMMHSVCNAIGYGWAKRTGYHIDSDGNNRYNLYSIANDAINSESKRQLEELNEAFESRRVEPSNSNVRWKSKLIEKNEFGFKREFTIKEMHDASYDYRTDSYWTPEIPDTLKRYVITITTDADDAIMTNITVKWE